MFTKGTVSCLHGLPIRRQSQTEVLLGSQRNSATKFVFLLFNFHFGSESTCKFSVWRNLSEAVKNHPEVDVVVNFASLRSAYDATIEVMQYPQIRTIAIIAEGIPENLTREMNRIAHQKNINIIGPATVGGIKPGCFKIGNTGGMLDNILSSKLYRPGR